MITITGTDPEGPNFQPGQMVTFKGDHGPPTGAYITLVPDSGPAPPPTPVPVDGATGTDHWSLNVTLPTAPGNYIFTVTGTGVPVPESSLAFTISNS